jgi:hypothetical protein
MFFHAIWAHFHKNWGHVFYEELADTHFLGKTSIPMKSSLMEKGIGVILSMGVDWLHFLRTKSSELQHLTILRGYTMDECVLNFSSLVPNVSSIL